MRTLGRVVSRVWGEDDGTVTIYSVMMLVLILAITGASVDLMHHEATRARLQSALDRAVLAAADIEQPQDAEDVVEDYVAKAGLAAHLTSIDADTGLNDRTVTATAEMELDTHFLHMAGISSLDVHALSTAEERIGNVEISLVLDVSGSMSGNRIENLRDAAEEFVETVIQDADEEGAGLTTVSIVPYNATVNLGEGVAPFYALSQDHDYSHCAIFPDNAFYDTAVPGNMALDRLSHFDPWSTNQYTTEISSPWCPTGGKSAVQVHSLDEDALENEIEALQAGGNTAIDLGMKWGVAFLDPEAQSLVSQLADHDLVDPRAVGRPAPYTDTETIKFVVVMTDGANTTEYDLKPQYKTGLSDVWIDERGTSDPSDDRFSLKVRDWQGTANDLWFWQRYSGYSWNTRNRSEPDGGVAARQMTHAELFARFGTKAVAKKLYTTPYYDGFVSYNDYYDIYYAYEPIVGGSLADTRLSNICTAAKDQGIVIFSVAFEAPEAGQLALADCASSASHYFDVAGVEITETFHTIARQINNLRLIQ